MKNGIDSCAIRRCGILIFNCKILKNFHIHISKIFIINQFCEYFTHLKTFSNSKWTLLNAENGNFINSLLTDSFKEFFKVRMRRSWENMPGTKSFPQNISAKRKNLFGHSAVLGNVWNKWSKARKCITRVISLNNIQIVVFKCLGSFDATNAKFKTRVFIFLSK